MLLLFVVAVGNVRAFHSSRWMVTQCCSKHQRIPTLSLAEGKSRPASTTRKPSSNLVVPLFESKNDDDDKMMQESSPSSSFDGQGFANYLAPYALALVGSIAVTALFVKFVLLDY